MRFTISINELIDAAHAAEANSSALFAAVGLLRWHEGNDKIVDLLREKGTRKHEQAERFKTLYEARLASRELLAPMAWQEKPSGEGLYAWQGDARDDLFDVTVTGNLMAAVGFKHYVENFGEFGGLWLKLPNVPERK